jgi:hypothetical protein
MHSTAVAGKQRRTNQVTLGCLTIETRELPEQKSWKLLGVQLQRCSLPSAARPSAVVVDSQNQALPAAPRLFLFHGLLHTLYKVHPGIQ